SIMDKLTDDDDIAEILFVESISSDCEKEDHFQLASKIENDVPENNLEMSIERYTFQEKSGYKSENEFIEFNINDCESLLDFNKQIISYLLELKKHITYALQKCEKKLKVLETNLQKHTIGDTKILICNAGMPYFKDRNYFFAPNNDDEILKENHKELQIRNLPKVSPWTMKERCTLLKAIREEAISNTLYSHKVERTRLNKVNEKKKINRFPPMNFVDMVGPVGGKEFDWFKISSIHFEEVHPPLDCCVMWNSFLHPKINKNRWTKPEDYKLKQIAYKYNYQNWDEIANELNTKRTAYQCFIRYNTTKKLPKIKNCIWEAEEDEKLLKLIDKIKIGDFIPWGEVASWMQNRTKQQAYFRWTYSLAPYLTKGRFSKSEDNILMDAVVKYGKNFSKIAAELLPNRTTVQLNYRYQILNTNKNKNWNVWMLADDLALLELHRQYGSNWSKISEAFTCKTRTHLRHRHAALQKYIKRGNSIYDLHRKEINGEEELEEESEESWEKNGNRLNDDCSNDVDQELIEYFRSKQATSNFIHKRKPCTAQQLKCDTKNVYKTLQFLNAKLHIPDDLSNLKLSSGEKQLLCSLREYIKLKNDEKTQYQVIDEYRSLMFGTSSDAEEEGTHYIPPPPFDSQIKLKKSKDTECIDYNLNTDDTFLVEKQVDFDTPDFVISRIGGNDQELLFQKLSQSFEMNSLKSKQTARRSQDFCTFAIGASLPQSNSNSSNNRNPSENASQETRPIVRCVSGTCSESNSVYSHNVKLESGSHEKPSEQTTNNVPLFSTYEKIHIPPNSSVDASTGQDVPSMEATHATLLGIQNLMYLKQLNEIRSNSYKITTKSKTFQKSLDLLETRLEQLFKYPIGQSKTVLPKVYVMDIFSYDDIAPKKKASEVSKIRKTYRTKKMRLCNKNSNNQK
ncbi:uncharacterized protein LOC128877302, partial [Hylaeus volcanicus]|uniref:uncharacterized protein LOC128877302 n=1 Tax=Hylaeus volcanicus TaxID=313075 RepID=UPI0023B851D2